MAEITFKIEIPDGSTINIGGLEALVAAATAAEVPAEESPDKAKRYWGYLSENGRRVFAQAARHEDVFGIGFTLEDLAHELSIDYDSIKSYHRSTGRAARRWRSDTGMSEPPIRLISVAYRPDNEHGGWRTQYQLPEGIAERILELERSPDEG